MRIFYRDESNEDQFYVGFAENVEAHLKDHNLGKSRHTRKYLPWRLISKHGFADRRKAADFENYLKSGSGRAFAKRHLR